MAELKVKVIKPCGVLSTGAYIKELNLVKWGKHPEVYDIRGWSPDHKECTKGVTLTKDELLKLKDILNTMTIE